MRKPLITMIAAMDKNRVIGSDNQMPWHLPDDLKFFKAKTSGKPVIMGRRTFESIGSRPLPNRRNLVITRDVSYRVEGAEIFDSIERAIGSCSASEEIIIMGGGQLYQQMMPLADKLYITLVDAEVEGDTLFPQWNLDEWIETGRNTHSKDAKHAFAFDFVTLVRRHP